MQLYLLRHAIAYDHGHPDYPDDDERPLTPKGRRKMKRVARSLEDIEADLIVTSPLPRARQTADILRGFVDVPLEVRDELRPGGMWEALLEWLRHRDPEPKGVVLVGHEPDLSGIAVKLLTGRPGSWLRLKKGGLIHLELDLRSRSPHATLKSLMTPKAMVRMR